MTFIYSKCSLPWSLTGGQPKSQTYTGHSAWPWPPAGHIQAGLLWARPKLELN